MNNRVTLVEASIMGLLIGVTCPTSLGGITSWRWWVYAILVNILLQSVYGVIKNWRYRAKMKKLKKELE